MVNLMLNNATMHREVSPERAKSGHSLPLDGVNPRAKTTWCERSQNMYLVCHSRQMDMSTQQIEPTPDAGFRDGEPLRGIHIRYRACIPLSEPECLSRQYTERVWTWRERRWSWLVSRNRTTPDEVCL